MTPDSGDNLAPDPGWQDDAFATVARTFVENVPPEVTPDRGRLDYSVNSLVILDDYLYGLYKLKSDIRGLGPVILEQCVLASSAIC
jgi:hypothetical protein